MQNRKAVTLVLEAPRGMVPGLPGVGVAAWLVFSLLAAAAVPWLYLFDARSGSNPDPFILGESAKEVLLGKRLYAETWMDKPPLGILIYALPQLVAPRSMAGIALFCGLCISATGAIAAYLFRHTPAAALASLLFVTLFPFSNWDYAWPSTEHFSNLAVMGALAIALMIHRRGTFSVAQCLAVGALACVAFHIRQNTLLCGIVPAVMILHTPGPLRKKLFNIAAMIAGGLLAWMLVLALVLAVGDLRGYLWTTFVYPHGYAGAGDDGVTLALVELLWAGPLPPILAVSACLALTRRNRPLVLALVAVGLIDCLIPRRHYGHYWVNSFPYVALLIGLGVERLTRGERGLAWTLPAGLALVLGPGVALRMHADSANPEYFRYREIAETADRIAPEQATLLVSGPMPCEAIQFASRLPAASRYWLQFHFQPGLVELLPQPWETIRAEYLAHPPGVIVVEEHYASLAASGSSAAVLPEYAQLLRDLMRQYRYRVRATDQGYAIAVRE